MSNYGLNLEWQLGKTAATIRFVKEAESYLSNQPRIGPHVALDQYVTRLKLGQEELLNWLTVEQFMNSFPIRNIG